jgi:hypothetical protein
VFSKVSKPYNYIYAGVALDVLDSEVQPLSRATARSSLHISPKFVMNSLRSGECSAMVSGHLRQAPSKPSPLRGSSRSSLHRHAFRFTNPCPFDGSPIYFPLFGEIHPRPALIFVPGRPGVERRHPTRPRPPPPSHPTVPRRSSRAIRKRACTQEQLATDSRAVHVRDRRASPGSAPP